APPAVASSPTPRRARRPPTATSTTRPRHAAAPRSARRRTSWWLRASGTAMTTTCQTGATCARSRAPAGRATSPCARLCVRSLGPARPHSCS
ncbi:hypothetical protein IWQ57_004223, partial [Coemansia nantahalensis]